MEFFPTADSPTAVSSIGNRDHSPKIDKLTKKALQIALQKLHDWINDPDADHHFLTSDCSTMTVHELRDALELATEESRIFQDIMGEAATLKYHLFIFEEDIVAFSGMGYNAGCNDREVTSSGMEGHGDGEEGHDKLEEDVEMAVASL
ncbi:uncharacterized protein FTJAE_5028 [Fusarium tjaetaba]|uniref:Uncharacterized protein n=1 Tax=Fusarium tjaetaba TaxID=1567544 RepID=A0A8H5VVG9_9HYPO|nr:uncharacterized protein FTJAE_5028 [Fusarium tjaetaba]KAF5638957.1 hypothetical protein FTJAE_5028 [Fusarium tjaetaba]